MRDMATVAERLRLVRRARRKFLQLWAIDRGVVDTLVEQLRRAVAETPENGNETARTREQE